MLIRIKINLLLSVLLIGCSSPESDSEPEVPQHTTYCTRFAAADATASGGIIMDTLQANWSPGSHLVITSTPQGVITSFDETTGELTYVPAQSRIPDRVRYELRDDRGDVLETYEHVWSPLPLRIMPLGDSITSGIDFYDGVDVFPAVNVRIGYRKSLYDQLSTNGFDLDFIGQSGQRAGQDAGLADPDNNGYPGVDIPFVNSKIMSVLDEGPSDVVLLHIGTNNTPNNADGLIQILDTIDAWAAQNFPVKVLVSTLVPKRDPVRQAIVDEFNTDLREQLATRLDNSVLVEHAQALTIADISSEEVGIHPNPEGYIKMANLWYASLLSSRSIQSCQ